MSQSKAAVILAAGKGKRMKSPLPKVLHMLNGRPLIHYVLDTLDQCGLSRTVVVVGFEGEKVEEALTGYDVQFAWQHDQLGTGHAVLMTAELMSSFEGTTLVALGDMPLLTVQSVQRLFDTHARTGAAATCLSARLDDPTGYGRVVREGDSEFLERIVEHKDASDEIRAIQEINTGLFCFDNRLLFDVLQEVGNDNAQGEYYLPDVIPILRSRGHKVALVTAEDGREGLGVNSVDQLADMERLTLDTKR